MAAPGRPSASGSPADLIPSSAGTLSHKGSPTLSDNISDTTGTTDSGDVLHDAFFALHHGLPRQGPGSDTTTRHLLSLAGPLPERPRVLDLGCGPGRSALLLAAEAGPR